MGVPREDGLRGSEHGVGSGEHKSLMRLCREIRKSAHLLQRCLLLPTQWVLLVISPTPRTGPAKCFPSMGGRIISYTQAPRPAVMTHSHEALVPLCGGRIGRVWPGL